MYKYSIFLYVFLSGCAQIDLKAGLSFNDEKGGQPEITGMVAPLGILRAEYETERDTTIFCEHISSLSENEHGTGLNHCGFLFKL